MTQHYSNPSRETDPHALPNIEVFELTAREVAELNDDMVFEWMRKHEYRLASMNSRIREKMFDAMIKAENIEGGWFYWYCFPGCMPDSEAMGPYPSRAAAVQAAQNDAAE